MREGTEGLGDLTNNVFRLSLVTSPPGPLAGVVCVAYYKMVATQIEAKPVTPTATKKK